MARRSHAPIDYSRLHEDGTTDGLPLVGMAELNIDTGEGAPPPPPPPVDDSLQDSRPEQTLAELNSTDFDNMAANELDQGDNAENTDLLFGASVPGHEYDDQLLDGAVNLMGQPRAEDFPEGEEGEPDLGLDEVWQEHQRMAQEESLKWLHIKKCLTRQILIAEQRVRAEKERQEIVAMQHQVRQLDQQRYGPQNMLQIPKASVPTYHQALVENVGTDRPADQITPHEKVNVWFSASPQELPPQVGTGLPNVLSNCRQALRDTRKEAMKAAVVPKMERPAHVTATSRPPMQQLQIQDRHTTQPSQHGGATHGGARPKARPRPDTENDGESVAGTDASDRSRKKDRRKSGFLEKPRSNVIVRLKWPHMNQNPRYVTSPLTFNQLNFLQFVGGECRTILKTADGEELYGRLTIFSKIAYLYDQCKSWEKARAAYFAIIGSIEEGEANWNSSWGHYDMMCPPTPLMEEKAEKNKNKTSNTTPKRDLFCRDFQKGECSMQAPHRLWIKNQYEQVEHFCLPCHKAKLGKLGHVPNSEECSQRK